MTPSSETDSSQWTQTILSQSKPHFCLLGVTSFVFFSLFLTYLFLYRPRLAKRRPKKLPRFLVLLKPKYVYLTLYVF